MISWLKISLRTSSALSRSLVFCFLYISFPGMIKSFAQAPLKAQKLAIDFIRTREPVMKASESKVFDTVSEFENIWIFERDSPKSFVLVKKEDEYQIAGYSFTNTFSINGEIPEPALLCLKALREISVEQHYQRHRAKSYPPGIAPLLETKWNQDCFFNHSCPTDFRGSCDHAAVGCVPVAMGQIMRYYGRFNKFVLEEKFESNQYPEETVILGNYNWDIMENEPVCIDLEVSRFLYHLGVISKVHYSYVTTSTSTYNAWVAFGKMTYLESLRMVRSLTNLETWTDAFYRNISQFMPIYVAGSGHAFVCDGYDSDGFFHFNLGWGGFADGFYPLVGTEIPFISEALLELRPHSLVLPPVNLQYKGGMASDSLVWDAHPYADILPFKYRIYQDEVEFDETEKTSFPANVFDPGKHMIKVTAWYINGESRWTGPIEVFNEGEDVDIPDINLKRSINLALGYDQTEADHHIPGKDELIEVKRITADQPVGDLTGIEHCDRLVELKLLDNQGTEFDISKLTANRYLKILEVNNAHILNHEDIGYLKNLVYLNLNNINLPSTDFLSLNSDLLSLSLKNTDLPSLDSLIRLNRLEFLDLSNTGLREAFFVEELEAIKQIDLSNNKIEEFEPESTLYNLRFINLSHNSLENIKFIEKFPNITSIDIGHNRIYSLELFKTFKNLFEIKTSNNNIHLVKINHIQPELINVDLSFNSISDIERLVEFAPYLEQLAINNNEISSLWKRSIQNLKHLDLSHNKLKTIEDIQLNPSLSHMDLSDNLIGDFYPLIKINFHETIDFLDLRGNPASKESYMEYYPLLTEQIDTILTDDSYNPYCPSYPIPLRDNNLNTNSVNLSWVTEDSEDIQGYDLYFGKAGQMELYSSQIAENQFTVDIREEQRYEWQVISHLQDSSFSSGIFSFRTFPPLEFPFFDGFESYQVNNRISIASPYWMTINEDYNSNDDGMVVGFRHFSGENALKIQGNAHVFLPADNLLSDILYIEFYLLVPQNNIACIRVTEISGIDLEIYFKVNKIADILINGKVVKSIQYTIDQWNLVRFTMNGQRDYFSILIEDKTHYILDWKYPTSKVQIENIELSGEKSPNFPSDGFPLYYLDDFKIRELKVVSTDNIEFPDGELKVYPNPAKDEFWIQFTDGSIVKDMRMINIYGQTILEIPNIQVSNPKKINSAGIKPGLYWLIYSTPKGPGQIKLVITP